MTTSAVLVRSESTHFYRNKYAFWPGVMAHICELSIQERSSKIIANSRPTWSILWGAGYPVTFKTVSKIRRKNQGHRGRWGGGQYALSKLSCFLWATKVLYIVRASFFLILKYLRQKVIFKKIFLHYTSYWYDTFQIIPFHQHEANRLKLKWTE
jgi:hypothetical protein